MAFLRGKNGECAACLKNSAHIFLEKIYKMGCLEGTGVPVLYIGRTVPKGESILGSVCLTVKKLCKQMHDGKNT
jgi:hypothetical protein